MKRRTIERLVIAFLFVAICVVFAERASRPPVARSSRVLHRLRFRQSEQ